MSHRFALRSYHSDGFKCDLTETFASELEAQIAAARFIRDYRDLCGLGVTCNEVAIVDRCIFMPEPVAQAA